MKRNSVSFSILSHAAWAPGLETDEAWSAWAKNCHTITGDGEAPVSPMAPLLRRRAGFLNRMALEVAYRCLGSDKNVPTIFASRHGEATRSVELLLDLAAGQPLSPTSFGLSVHNATGGLFSIARRDHASDIALAGGQSTVEHAVIEACGLLTEGESRVLLVVYDCPLPAIFTTFQDCREQPFAWAWLMQAPSDEVLSLSWGTAAENDPRSVGELPPGLEVLRFYLRRDASLERARHRVRWLWRRDA
ncbi:MAG: beta-ketoacyl synthase chain length factor [Deltaproteobacteria bacterium]|nr:beta-ketoacyl synthase chain length factor [Deltaproteobacteria bacterium]